MENNNQQRNNSTQRPRRTYQARPQGQVGQSVQSQGSPSSPKRRSSAPSATRNESSQSSRLSGRNTSRPTNGSNNRRQNNSSRGRRPIRNANQRNEKGQKSYLPIEPGGRTIQRRKVMKPHPHRAGRQKQENNNIPPIENGVIRIIPLGGVEQVGQNCTAIEIGNDIIVIDAGFEFRDEMVTPGVDYIIPNTTYLEQNKDRIRGMFITHGHLDHIGGIPFIINKIGNPPIYSRDFGALMIAKRHTEFPQLPDLNIVKIGADETIVAGEMRVKTFSISHTIPDSMGLIIDTPYGDIVFIEDVRVDNVDGIPTDEEIEQYSRFKKKEKPTLLLTMDSTGVEKPGWSMSENVVVENLEPIIRDTTGRLIIGTFASQVERILAIINLAKKFNKKVILEGRSMKSNMEIVKQLNLIDTHDKTLQPISALDELPPDRVIMIVTGAQGEEFAAMMRMANKSHKHVTLRPSDTVLLSSSVIPSNHAQIMRLKDKLYRSEANIITYMDSHVHASGHGSKEELRWIHQQIPHKFFIPLHGEHHMLYHHKQLALEEGVPEENVMIPDNGAVFEIYAEGTKIRRLDARAPHAVVTVDGFSVGELQEVVMRDRNHLEENGIFVVVASINTRTKKLRKSPDIISRGFVYLRESQDLIHESRDKVRSIIESKAKNMQTINFDKLKDAVADEMTKYLFQETAKSPLVIPVILGV